MEKQKLPPAQYRRIDRFDSIDEFKVQWNIRENWSHTICCRKNEFHFLILYRRKHTDFMVAIEEDNGKIIRYKIRSPIWEQWRTYEAGEELLLKAINDHIDHINAKRRKEYDRILTQEAERRELRKRLEEEEEKRKIQEKRKREREEELLAKGEAYQKALMKQAGHKPCTKAEAARYLGISSSRVSQLMRRWDFPKVWVSEVYIDREGLEEYKQKLEAGKLKRAKRTLEIREQKAARRARVEARNK